MIVRPLPPNTHPPRDFQGYKSTALRHPQQPLLAVPQDALMQAGPLFYAPAYAKHTDDLTIKGPGAPLGERIIVHGNVTDEDGKPLTHTLVELWQCNAAGRYQHPVDQHDAPLDPNFVGGGMAITDEKGRYQFVTIKPGAYPWRNHPNAWRPAHLHFSIFGRSLLQRLVTQMYFPGDPLLAYDPIFGGLPSAKAQDSLIARFDMAGTKPEWALAYEFNIVLSGSPNNAGGTPAQHS